MSSTSTPTSLTTSGNVSVGGSLSVSGSCVFSQGVTNTTINCSSLTNTGTTLLNGMTSSGDIVLNKKTMYLSTDTNHLLRFVGSSNTFASYTTDGPALIGYSGVLLGTRYVTDSVQLVTDTSGVSVNGYLKLNNNHVICSGIGTSGVKVAYGTSSGGWNGTISFGTTFTSAPVVVGNVITSNTTNLYVVQFYSITTTGCSYSKLFYPWGGGTGGTASTESFSWMAIGV